MKAIDAVLKWLITGLMVVCLAAMSIFVFLNVILRYFFESGIPWSDEMSRFLMVYMVFFGAILALKDNEHLGVDTLVKRFPVPIRRFVYIVVNLIVVYMLYLIGEGSWKMMLLSRNSFTPATGFPLSYVYAVGVAASACMALVLLGKIYLVLKDKDHILKMKMAGSEDEIPRPDSEAASPSFEMGQANAALAGARQEEGGNRT